MNAEASILVVDDEQGAHASIARVLAPCRYAVRGVVSAEEGLALLQRETFDLVLSDIRLGGMDGLAFQKLVRGRYPDIPVIMITAFGEVETAVGALKQGAYDYLIKPFSGEELRHAVRRALESRRLRIENDSLRAVQRGGGTELLVGGSAAMKRLYDEASQVADSSATVFISGESGSGKEVLARYLHAHSDRREKVFVAVNCAAVPESLADSQLFGHIPGAFTGAVAEQRGMLELAHGGTLFLDEIAELKLEIQAKLLRVLEERRLRRLGSEREIALDVRVLAAAQKEPEQLVKDGALRQDLFFRIGAIQLRVPPLRERPGDIVPLALHFLAGFAREIKKPIAGLDPEVGELLARYAWPGNVRELKNVMERAAIFVRPGAVVAPSELSEKLRQGPGAAVFTIAAPQPPPLREVSRAYMQFVLGLCEGNQTQAARVLGVAPSTIWRVLSGE